MKIIAILLFAFTTVFAHCQTGGSESEKARKAYTEGRQAMRMGMWAEAEQAFNKALKADPEFLDAHYALAELCISTNRLPEGKAWLEKMISLDARFAPEAMLTMGYLHQMESDFKVAKVWIERFLKVAPPESAMAQEARLASASCSFAMEAVANPVPFNPVNLGDGVNTTHWEYFPALTVDQRSLLFTRRQPRTDSPNGEDEDFYFSEKGADGRWGAAFNPGPPINSVLNEGAPTLSAEGNTVIFTACEMDGFYGRDKKGYGSCDLFFSQRSGSKWTKPENLGPAINSKAWESQPSLSSDGKWLYFIRGRLDQERRRHDDIYVAELLNGRWQTAVPLPSNVNTDGQEESVFIHPDGNTLYFSSQGHVGMGDMDIYFTRKQRDGTWSNPSNLGYPINTVGTENSIVVGADGQLALFASDREGGRGALDIYSFELPAHARPTPTTYVKGTVRNAQTKAAMAANVKVVELSSSDTLLERSLEADGRFFCALPATHRYALLAEAEGFLPASEAFELLDVNRLTPFEIEVLLEPVGTGKAVVLRNIFFDVDRYDLKPESEVELNRLASWLSANAALRIELSGHTDSDGDQAANLLLSQRRAEAVKNYLVTKGITSERLLAKGLGETAPVADNATADGRAMNRRIEFQLVP